jgi:hypothetical protein
MKKVFLFFAVLIFSASLSAQSYYRSYDHHDISVSYGMFLPDQFNNLNSSMLNDLYPEQRYVGDEYSSPGAVFITYRHMFKNELFLWGITAGLSSSSSQVYNVGQYEGELKRQYYTLALEWEYRYVNQGIIQVYSGLGLGFTYGTEELTPPSTEEGATSTTGDISSVGYQVNAVGIRIGKKFGGYAEFGYGYKGIFNVGLSVQLF